MSWTAAKVLDQRPRRMIIETFLAWDDGGHVGKLQLGDGLVHTMAPPYRRHGRRLAPIGQELPNAAFYEGTHLA